MASPIRLDAPQVTAPPAPTPPMAPLWHEVLQQKSSQTLSASIRLQTAEGDTVTISSLSHQQSWLATESLATPARLETEVRMTAESQSGLALSVQGDLSEEELADIQELMTDLTSISAAFFAGDYQGAMEQAANLGDMGSVATLSASFARQASWSRTLSASGHPLPSNMPGASSVGMGLPEPGTGTPSQGLLARWQQLLAALPEKEIPAPTPRPSSPAATASRMLERLRHSIAQHPRIAPLAEPLAEKAMRKGVLAAPPELDHARTSEAFRWLRQSFAEQWQEWLLGAEPPLPADPATGQPVKG
ncbi:MAG: hypothetical protein ACOY3Z_11515 [Thermodesulfobacteriota bacterium]